VKKQANAQIEELEAEMHRLSLEVRDGGTYREVPCERRYIYRTGNVQEVRTDTGDVLSERAMTDRERQLELGVNALKSMGAKEVKDAEGVVDDDYRPEGSTEEPLPTPGVEARVDTKRIAAGTLHRDEWDRLAAAAPVLAKLPLSLRYLERGTVNAIRSTTLTVARKFPPWGAVLVALAAIGAYVALRLLGVK